jgi:hypothetical protein
MANDDVPPTHFSLHQILSWISWGDENRGLAPDYNSGLWKRLSGLDANSDEGRQLFAERPRQRCQGRCSRLERPSATGWRLVRASQRRGRRLVAPGLLPMLL